MKRLERHEDEWRRKLQKLEEEWTKKLESKEEEWKKLMEEKQKEWRRSLELLEKEKSVLEEEKREVVQQKLNLEEALKVTDGVLCCFLQFPLACLTVTSSVGKVCCTICT
jgi:hypothetical protein